MPTPAEKKALLFIGAVALLGGGVRFWRVRHHAPDPPRTEVAEGEMAGDADDPSPARRSRSPKRTSAKRASAKSGNHGQRRRKRAGSKRTSPAADDFGGAVEGPATIDLDRATIADITSLGIVSTGVARMIVEDREEFGPFGSIQELKRVPYLTRYSIEKLAPRVTFSLLPRPKNAVLQGRTSPPALPTPRRRPKTQ